MLVALLLGIVQGTFVFVPVSSTSHLVLTQTWLRQRGVAVPAPESPEMVLSTAVTGVLGLLFCDPLTAVFGSPRAVAGALVVTGGMLWWTDAMQPGRGPPWASFGVRVGARDGGPRQRNRRTTLAPHS